MIVNFSGTHQSLEPLPSSILDNRYVGCLENIGHLLGGGFLRDCPFNVVCLDVVKINLVGGIPTPLIMVNHGGYGLTTFLFSEIPTNHPLRITVAPGCSRMLPGHPQLVPTIDLCETMQCDACAKCHANIIKWNVARVTRDHKSISRHLSTHPQIPQTFEAL